MADPPAGAETRDHRAGSSAGLPLAHGALAALVAARLVVMPWGAMWLWGLNTQRFLVPVFAVSLWVAMALPFIGRGGMWLATPLERLGDRLAASHRVRVIAAAAFAFVVWLLDDRTLFTGDSLIRRVASDSPEFIARFQQSLPLELLLFERLPLALQGFLLPAGMLPRLLGAVAAYALALAGIELGLMWSRRGAARVAIACLVAGGGYLAICTGLGKPSALLCAATALTALLGVRAATTGRGLGLLGPVVFVALLLHRAGALLLPAWLAAVALAVNRYQRGAAPPRGPTWAFAMLPLAALLAVGPRLLHIVWAIDVPHHVASGATAASGSPWRAVDLLNLSLLMVPAALPLLLAGVRRPREWLRTREAAVLLALLVPWLMVAAVATPTQGVFRDLDFLAPGAVALAATCAWILSHLPQHDAGSRRLVAAVAATSLVSAFELLACFHDPAGGLERVRAYLSEAPARTAGERETTWDFLALRAFALRDWPLAADACEHAARIAPSPRLLTMLGIARTYVGDYAGARQAYTQLLERSPHELIAWAGLAGLAARLHDPRLADSALVHVRSHADTSVKARELRRVIDEYPEFWPNARP